MSVITLKEKEKIIVHKTIRCIVKTLRVCSCSGTACPY